MKSSIFQIKQEYFKDFCLKSLFEVYLNVVCTLGDTRFFLTSVYQDIVKATVSGVLEDLKQNFRRLWPKLNLSSSTP